MTLGRNGSVWLVLTYWYATPVLGFGTSCQPATSRTLTGGAVGSTAGAAGCGDTTCGGVAGTASGSDRSLPQPDMRAGTESASQIVSLHRVMRIIESPLSLLCRRGTQLDSISGACSLLRDRIRHDGDGAAAIARVALEGKTHGLGIDEGCWSLPGDALTVPGATR